jgi:hypothetical protein
MTRIALAVILAVEALLGPSVCCCSLAGSNPSNKQAAPKPEDKKSCCHSAPTDAPSKTVPRDDSVPREPCPCQSERTPTVVPADTDASDIVQRLGHFASAAFQPFEISNAAMPILKQDGPVVSHFIDATSLIDAHHLLRC